MKKVSIIGLDLAKRSFHAHCARADGRVGFRKNVRARRSSPFSQSNRAGSSPWRPAAARIIGGGPSAIWVTRFV